MKLTDLQESLIRNAIERRETEKLKNLFYYIFPEGNEYRERFRSEPTVEKAKELFKELTGETIE